MNQYENEYFKWLVGLLNERVDSSMGVLLRQLFNIDFTYSIANDANREFDGLRLREEYSALFDKEALSSEVKPCSVLEVMVGFAKRVADEVLGDGSDNEAGFRNWIRLMLKNLGIIDSSGNVIRTKGEICTIVERWMRRDFDQYGNYSPFPIRVKNVNGDIFYAGFNGRLVPFEDQRTIEIWKQFCIYLAEHPELEEM